MEQTETNEVAAACRLDDALESVAQAVLDHVHFGLAVVGADLELLFANRAARRECASHPDLEIAGGRLLLREPRFRAEFLRALHAVRSGVWSLLQVPHDSERIVLALRPLGGRPTAVESAAVVMFGLRSQSKPFSVQFYAKSCGLSPVETEVLRLLGEGLSPREIARRHGVALSTVRSQLGCVRGKTGTRTLTDLVGTLGRLPPLMPSTPYASREL